MSKKRIDSVITIEVFHDIESANLAKKKLKEAGISSLVKTENTRAGIELKIFSSDLIRAFKILSE